jgi:hypothetical protein
MFRPDRSFWQSLRNDGGRLLKDTSGKYIERYLTYDAIKKEAKKDNMPLRYLIFGEITDYKSADWTSFRTDIINSPGNSTIQNKVKTYRYFYFKNKNRCILKSVY